MTIGLQPKAKAVAYKRIGFETETMMYWTTRRAMVMQTLHEAIRTRDREARADALQRLREFNKEVRKIEPRLMMNVQEVQQSIKQRIKIRTRQEVLGSPTNNPTLTRTIRETVPLEEEKTEF